MPTWPATATRSILRPQEISNHPELIRRLGCIAMNGMIEADIYGNVNSTHIMGITDPERHRRLGRLRAQRLCLDLHDALDRQGRHDLRIVPHGHHVDHIEQDVQVIVTEQGLADLRGLPQAAGAKSSSRTAPIRTIGRRWRTISGGPKQGPTASSRRACSAKHCHGTSASSRRVRCGVDL